MPPGSTPTPPQSSGPAFVGNCRVTGQIGSGGMAVIYKAVQESLHRTVAVKALKTSVSKDAQLLARFEREALSLSSLQHENIIHVYDFHQIDDSLYIVLEYVEGIDLYDLLDRCPRLPADVAAIVTLQVARALDYAHYRGIIHRDIKPANIMIGKHGGVKLMDFGIARDPNFSDLTEAGTGLGTPSYMSPEQILGDKLDFRSDLFSLGIVLYQMLCGRKPFVEDEKKSVMHKIRLEKYPPPRQFAPSLPRELEHILSRAMAKRKEQRFRSTQEMVQALERFVSRHVDMNYHARLVLFLRDLRVITEDEYEAQMAPSMNGSAYGNRAPSQATQQAFKNALVWQAGILLGMAVLTGFVHAVPVGNRGAPPTAEAATIAARGFLQVIAVPWADVWVDGKKLETTPFATPLSLDIGSHKIVLRHPSWGEEEHPVSIERGKLTVLRANFKRP